MKLQKLFIILFEIFNRPSGKPFPLFLSAIIVWVGLELIFLLLEEPLTYPMQ